MSYLISDIKNDLERKLHGTTLDKISSPLNLIYEAARNVLLRIDPQETLRVANITNALYDDVFSYPIPTDLKGHKIKDIRPQVNRGTNDNFSRLFGEEFDIYKNNNTFTIEDNSGVRTIRISKDLREGSLLHDMNSVTDNGTWAVGGNAASLAADDLNYITGSSSLKFNVTSGATSSYIENSTMTAVDLTDYQDVGVLFVWVYIPSTTDITAVTLRWGSSSSDYYSVAVTAASDDTAFRVGWNLCRFDWASATTTGTPVVTAIDYLRVTLTTTTTAITGVRVDNIIARLGTIFEIVYFSNALFRTSAGTWKEVPTLDTDIINLSTESYNVLLYELCELTAQEIQGEDSSFDVDYWKRKKNEVWSEYLYQNPSAAIKAQSTYYRDLRRRRR